MKRGFSLIEVVLALAIVSFCLVLLVGLLPIGLKTNQISSEEFRAMNLMTALITDVEATPQTERNSRIYQVNPLPSSEDAKEKKEIVFYIDESGKMTKTDTGTLTRFKVLWVYTRVPEKESLDPIEAWIKISWPIASKQGKTENSVETYAAFRR